MASDKNPKCIFKNDKILQKFRKICQNILKYDENMKNMTICLKIGKYDIWPLHFRGHKYINRAHLIVCIRSEIRKQNMTFHKLPGSNYHFLDFKIQIVTVNGYNIQNTGGVVFKSKPKILFSWVQKKPKVMEEGHFCV